MKSCIEHGIDRFVDTVTLVKVVCCWLIMVVIGEFNCVNSYIALMEMYACCSLAFGWLIWIWLLALALTQECLPKNKIYKKILGSN